MKKIFLLLVLIVIFYFAYINLAFTESEYYQELKRIEIKYDLDNSNIPKTEDDCETLIMELKSLIKNLEQKEDKEARAIFLLTSVRLDMAESAKNLYEAKRYYGAPSPFSDNCSPNKPIYKAKVRLDAALSKAQEASKKMESFLEDYKDVASKYGIIDYAKRYYEYIKKYLEEEKESLDIFC
ncbi:MAG: hypothetical protein N3D73_02500 [Candidatus Diapherotrites archaeon]|nr:hypothetical protein [Candidatus Diapherotrites archaeon]